MPWSAAVRVTKDTVGPLLMDLGGYVTHVAVNAFGSQFDCSYCGSAVLPGPAWVSIDGLVSDRKEPCKRDNSSSAREPQ